MFRRLTLAALIATLCPALANEHGHEPAAPAKASKPAVKQATKGAALHAAEAPAAESSSPSAPAIPATVKEQVQRLIDGNRRYVEGRMLNIERDAARLNDEPRAAALAS